MAHVCDINLAKRSWKFCADEEARNEAGEISTRVILSPSGMKFENTEGCRRYLLARSERAPTVLIFLRQIGCTFAKEALDQLSKELPQLKRLGVDAAVVHMSDPATAQIMLNRFGLQEISHFSDPSTKLYKSFGIGKGRISQILGLKVIIRGLWLAARRGYGIAYGGGDCFQMPGVVVFQDGNVINQHVYKHVGEKVSYTELLAAAHLEHQRASGVHPVV